MYQLECMYTCGVIQLVSKNRTLDWNDIDYLNNLYQSLQGKNFSRYYNLFSVTRKDVPPKLDDYRWSTVKSKLDVEGRGECITNYFLYYGPGSFTMPHTDSPLRVTKTAITLIDKSADLVGGDIIVIRRVKQFTGNIHIPTDEEIKRKNEPVPVMNNVTAVNVIKQDVGETVWYPAQMKHGVSQVEQGYRLVLISWYKNEDNQVQKETV